MHPTFSFQIECRFHDENFALEYSSLTMYFSTVSASSNMTALKRWWELYHYSSYLTSVASLVNNTIVCEAIMLSENSSILHSCQQRKTVQRNVIVKRLLIIRLKERKILSLKACKKCQTWCSMQVFCCYFFFSCDFLVKLCYNLWLVSGCCSVG